MTKCERFKKVLDEIDVADCDALLGLLKFRRSLREFLRDSVSRELIEKIFEAARYAPSGANSQPWEFGVIEERDHTENSRAIRISDGGKGIVGGHSRKENADVPGGSVPGFRRSTSDEPFHRRC